MAAEPLMSQDETDSLVERAKGVARRTAWLSPLNAISSVASTVFGRRIEEHLRDLSQREGVIKLQLRRRDTAVVMNIDHYQELLQIKAMMEELVTRGMSDSLAQASAEYDALYARIRSPQSRQAADALFALDAPDLSASYQPGSTETR